MAKFLSRSFMMNHWIQKSVVAFLGLGLAMTSTGCMTSPGHGEHIGNVEGLVDFNGYLMEGKSWVKIQAKHPTKGWKTIGWAKSKSWSYEYDGSEWFPWYTSVKIPGQYWSYLGSGNPKGHYKARVRAVQYSTGSLLPTFKKGYNSWFNYYEPLSKMWSDHGHGNEVTVYGNIYLY